MNHNLKSLWLHLQRNIHPKLIECDKFFCNTELQHKNNQAAGI